MFDRLKAALTGRLDADIGDDHVGPTAAAMLLLEIAWADHEIVAEEVEGTRRALVDLFGLSDEAAAGIVAAAQRSHKNSISMYPFTRAANDALSYEEKKELLVCCWRLALADAHVDRHEEHTIRRIADLLYLSHDDFIAAKLAAKRTASQ